MSLSDTDAELFDSVYRRCLAADRDDLRAQYAARLAAWIPRLEASADEERLGLLGAMPEVMAIEKRSDEPGRGVLARDGVCLPSSDDIARAVRHAAQLGPSDQADALRMLADAEVTSLIAGLRQACEDDDDKCRELAATLLRRNLATLETDLRRAHRRRRIALILAAPVLLGQIAWYAWHIGGLLVFPEVAALISLVLLPLSRGGRPPRDVSQSLGRAWVAAILDLWIAVLVGGLFAVNSLVLWLAMGAYLIPYRALCAGRSGQTPGMLLASITVITKKGGLPSFRQSLYGLPSFRQSLYRWSLRLRGVARRIPQ